MQAATKPKFRWSVASQEISYLVKGVPTKNETPVLVRNDDPQFTPYLEVHFGKHQAFLVKLEDCLSRVDENQNHRTQLTNDLQEGWFQFELWRNNGEEVKKDFAVNWKTRHPDLVFELVFSKKVDRIGEYEQLWRNTLERAIKDARTRLNSTTASVILHRFFTPKQTTVQLYFAPTEAAVKRKDFSFDALKVAVDSLGHQCFGVQAAYLKSNSEARAKHLIPLSHNPLGFYATWVTQQTLRNLVGLQTQNGSWIRTLPSQPQVKAFNQELMEIPAVKETLKINSTSPIVSQPPFEWWAGSTVPTGQRLKTESIMGSSANAWATNKLKWTGGKVVAEWLHRIAHRFEQSKADRFSNLIFGTHESNTDMIRAEAAVTRLMLSKKVMALQVTATSYHEKDKAQMLDKPDADGETLYLVKPTWDSDTMDYSRWLTLKLDYRIKYQTSEGLRPVRESVAEFYPFSRQCPLRYEYELDRIVLDNFLHDMKIQAQPLPNAAAALLGHLKINYPIPDPNEIDPLDT